MTPLITLITSNPVQFFIILLSLILSVGIHEFCHVYAAYLQGDQTGKMMGRLTLNPIAHIEPMGLIAMLVAGIGWGKPAPFNPQALRYRRWGTFLVAIAGPISNIILMTIFGWAGQIALGHLPESNLMVVFCLTMAYLNAGLAIFNLFPIPPLDGSRILSGILGPHHPFVVALERYGFVILIIVLVALNGLIMQLVQGGATFLLRIVGLG